MNHRQIYATWTLDAMLQFFDRIYVALRLFHAVNRILNHIDLLLLSVLLLLF